MSFQFMDFELPIYFGSFVKDKTTFNPAVVAVVEQWSGVQIPLESGFVLTLS